MGQAGASREPAVRWRLLDQRTWLLRVVTVRQMSAIVDQRTRGAGHEGRLKSVDWRGAAQLGEAGAAPHSPNSPGGSRRSDQLEVQDSQAGTSLASRMTVGLGHRPPQTLPLDWTWTWTWTWTTVFRVRWQVAGGRFHVKHEAGAGPERRPTPRTDGRRSFESVSRPVDTRPWRATHFVAGHCGRHRR